MVEMVSLGALEVANYLYDPSANMGNISIDKK